MVVPDGSLYGPTAIMFTPWTVGGPLPIVENRVVSAEAVGAAPIVSGATPASTPINDATIVSSRNRRHARCVVAARSMPIMAGPFCTPDGQRAVGVAVATVLQGPGPTLLRAATRNRYEVPLLSLAMVRDGVVETPSRTVVHGLPPIERWIT